MESVWPRPPLAALLLAGFLAFSIVGPVRAGTDCASGHDDFAIAGPIVPARVDIKQPGTPWQEAMQKLWSDGAVIVSGLADPETADYEELARGLPARLFGGAGPGAPTLLSPDAPVSSVHDELREAKRQGKYLPGSGLLPHTDGYVYGDHLPDFVFLLCEQPSSRGGANTLIDGKALFAALAAGDAEERELNEWLAKTPVDLAEHSDMGITAGREASGPVVQWHATQSGFMRLKWRRQLNTQEVQKLDSWKPLPKRRGKTSGSDAECPDLPTNEYLSLWRPLPSMGGKEAADALVKLRRFDAFLQRMGAAAARNSTFMLQRGEALIVDNYRVLHARAPYVPSDEDTSDRTSSSTEKEAMEKERRLWRVWSWTSEGSGLPPDGVRTSQPLNASVFNDDAAPASCFGSSCSERHEL